MGQPKILGVGRAYFRRWRSRFRIIPAACILLAIVGTVVTTASPSMRAPGRSWYSPASWRAVLGEVGLAILCAVYLRYEEKVRRYLAALQGAQHGWTVRMTELARIIDGLKELNLTKTGEVVRLRHDILVCVASGVAEVLDLPADTVCANLLDIGPQKGTMVVSGRSSPLREYKGEYKAVPEFVPWRAIEAAGMEIDDDYREREGLGPRQYKSVAAIPVTRDELAYGSLSIDCTIAFAFSGQKKRIFYQVRPYLSLLAQTYGPSSPTHPCKLNPAKLK